MSPADYLPSIVLILIVLRQVQPRRLAWWMVWLPLLVVGVIAALLLHRIPTSGNDLALIVVCSVTGLALGVLCAVFTHVYPGPGGNPYARVGLWAAIVWIVGVGARLAFAAYAEDGGGQNVYRFTVAHGLTIAAWGPALILMALLEVVGRSGGLAWRGYGQRVLGLGRTVSPVE